MRKVLFWGHLALGVVAGTVVLLMSATGALLAFEKQIVAWSDRSPRAGAPVALDVETGQVSGLLAAGAAALPGERLTALTISSAPGTPALATVGGRVVAFAPATAAPLGDASPRLRAFFRQVTSWHRYLGASGPVRAWTRVATGWGNAIFLVLIVSGVCLWIPRSWRALRAVTWFRRGLTPRARDFNWHNVAGVWCALPLALIVLTALPMSFPWANAGLFRLMGEEPPASPGGRGPGRGSATDARPTEGARDWTPVARAVATAVADEPAWRTVTIRPGASPSSPTTLVVDRGTAGQPQFRTTLTADGTGRITKREDFGAGTPGRQARTFARFAHTGEFFGLAGQLIAGLASAGAVLLVWTGLSLALRRFVSWRGRGTHAASLPRVRAAAVLLCASVVALPGVSRAQDGGPGGGQMVSFAIPQGTLDEVLATFTRVTGVEVTWPAQDGVRAIVSAGLTGTFSPREAFDRLLAGTGLAAREIGPGRIEIEIRAADEHVRVLGIATPWAVERSSAATKIDAPLRDIPQSITVVPRAVLAEQGAQSVGDAMRNVPGVSVAQGEGNRDQVVLRGTSSASDFYVNGVRDDQERFRDLYNVERVEVVQGPAAVLFGRGGAGGVVNLSTRVADAGLPSDASLELGSFGHRRGSAFLSGGSARAAVGLSVMGQDSASFRDGFFLRRYGVNPTLRLNRDGGTRVTLGYERLWDERLADRGVPSDRGAPVAVDPGQFFGSLRQNLAHSDHDAVSATIEREFARGVRLRNSFLVGDYRKSYQNVFPGSAVTAARTFSLSAYNHDIDRTNLFNQSDLVIERRTGALGHTLLAGVEVGHQAQKESRHTASAIPNVPLGSSVRDADFATAPITVDRHATADIAAAYAQDQLAFGAHLKALVGVRVDRFSVAVDDQSSANVDLTRVDVAASPRAGLVFQPTSATSFYGSYSYTFLPSGQTLGLAANTAELEPEDARNYEVGTKLDLARQRLQITGALFRLDRNHVKSTDPNDPTKLVLTGQQRTEGFAASAAGSLTSRWKLTAAYANLRARVLRATSAAAGRTVGLVPHVSASLWSTVDVSRRWTVGGGLTHQARMFASLSNLVELPAFTRADAMVAMRVGAHRLVVNGENLLNARYFPTANGDNNISPGSTRSIRVSLRTTF